MEPHLELCGSYGLTPDFEYKEQGTGLRILKPIQPPFDLNLLEGFKGDNAMSNHIYANRDKFGNTLTWLLDHHEPFTSESCERLFNFDIFCGNGVFSPILTSPFDKEERFFLAMKYKGLIFIRRGQELIRVRDPRDEKPSYAGNKFQELMTERVDSEDIGQRYYNVIKAKLGDHVILYSYQADCIKEQVDSKPGIDDFVELRTSNWLRDKYDHSQFSRSFKEDKTKYWWSVQVMTGIKEFVIGIKHYPPPDFIYCKKLERLTLDDLKRNASGWSPIAAMAFLNNFFKEVRKVVTEDDHEIVYKFKINCEEIRHEKLSSTESQQYSSFILSPSMVEKLDEFDTTNE